MECNSVVWVIFQLQYTNSKQLQNTAKFYHLMQQQHQAIHFLNFHFISNYIKLTYYIDFSLQN